MKKEHIFIIILIIIVGGISALAIITNKRSKIDKNPELTVVLNSVAHALKDSGTKFYGASWCPHCMQQKEFFKTAVKELPYIECSTAGAGSPQTQVCIDAKIESYPTWEFAPGVRGSLEIIPMDLASIINYPLDDNAKLQLQVQKDEYLAKMEAKQKDAYVKEIETLKKDLAKSKK